MKQVLAGAALGAALAVAGLARSGLIIEWVQGRSLAAAGCVAAVAVGLLVLPGRRPGAARWGREIALGCVLGLGLTLVGTTPLGLVAVVGQGAWAGAIGLGAFGLGVVLARRLQGRTPAPDGPDVLSELP